MVAVNDCIQVRVMATFDGEPVVNTLSFAVVDPALTFQEQANTLLDQLDSTLGLQGPTGEWTDGLSVQYKIQSVQALDIFPGTNAMIARPSSAVGSVADDDAMPPNDSMCLTLRSFFKGPSGRGRIYFTGFAEGSANGGYWEAGAQAYGTGIGDILFANFGEEGTSACRWAILHRYAGGSPVVPPEIKPVMSYNVRNEVRSLGRRAVGRRVRRRPTP